MLLPPLPAAPPSTAAFAVDLFLVGSNPQPLENLEWLAKDKAFEDSPVRAILRRELAPLVLGKRSFVVMDGGDGSLFATAKPWNEVHVALKSFDAYDSMTETINGKTRVLERTQSETTTSGGVSVGANGPKGYVSQTFVHFGSGAHHPMLAFMDVNSYRQATLHGHAQDKEFLPASIVFSDDSTYQTERYLQRNQIEPPGPVLCRTGIPRASDGQVTAFPPAGVVSRYRLVQTPHGWRLRFVAFLR